MATTTAFDNGPGPLRYPHFPFNVDLAEIVLNIKGYGFRLDEIVLRVAILRLVLSGIV